MPSPPSEPSIRHNAAEHHKTQADCCHAGSRNPGSIPVAGIFVEEEETDALLILTRYACADSRNISLEICAV